MIRVVETLEKGAADLVHEHTRFRFDLRGLSHASAPPRERVELLDFCREAVATELAIQRCP